VALDVLEQGREPGRAPRDRPRRSVPRPAVVAAATFATVTVVVAGAAQVRQDQPPPRADAGADLDADLAGLRPPLPRVLIDRASVVRGREGADGVVALDVRLQGLPQAQLLSLDVELPGSAVVLAPLPDRLTGDGTALLGLQVLPQCPAALPGLSRAAITGVVRGRPGARVRTVRVRLDTAGVLAEVVRARCGDVAGVPELVTSPVQLAAAAPGALSTRIGVSAAGARPVSVVAVRPGPGVRAHVRTPLPIDVVPGAPPVPLLVDLRPGGCGGAPDTPPYLLVLDSGATVATSVGAGLQAPLDGLRPYLCAG
jgi:hypothetical protein